MSGIIKGSTGTFPVIMHTGPALPGADDDIPPFVSPEPQPAVDWTRLPGVKHLDGDDALIPELNALQIVSDADDGDDRDLSPAKRALRTLAVKAHAEYVQTVLSGDSSEGGDQWFHPRKSIFGGTDSHAGGVSPQVLRRCSRFNIYTPDDYVDFRAALSAIPYTTADAIDDPAAATGGQDEVLTISAATIEKIIHILLSIQREGSRGYLPDKDFTRHVLKEIIDRYAAGFRDTELEKSLIRDFHIFKVDFDTMRDPDAPNTISAGYLLGHHQRHPHLFRAARQPS